MTERFLCWSPSRLVRRRTAGCIDYSRVRQSPDGISARSGAPPDARGVSGVSAHLYEAPTGNAAQEGDFEREVIIVDGGSTDAAGQAARWR